MNEPVRRPQAAGDLTPYERLQSKLRFTRAEDFQNDDGTWVTDPMTNIMIYDLLFGIVRELEEIKSIQVTIRNSLERPPLRGR